MARKFSKTYLAIVTPGPPVPAAGVINLPLRRDEQGREAYMRICPPDHTDAETARSRYRTLKAASGAALMELDPDTGRMHQLRVHMAALGHPIAGDARYGGALVVGGEAVPRLMLHARSLAFPHPAGGEKRLEAEPPVDMRSLIASLGLG